MSKETAIERLLYECVSVLSSLIGEDERWRHSRFAASVNQAARELGYRNVDDFYFSRYVEPDPTMGSGPFP